MKYRAIGDLAQRVSEPSTAVLCITQKGQQPDEKREAVLGSSPYTDEEEQEKI